MPFAVSPNSSTTLPILGYTRTSRTDQRITVISTIEFGFADSRTVLAKPHLATHVKSISLHEWKNWQGDQDDHGLRRRTSVPRNNPPPEKLIGANVAGFVEAIIKARLFEDNGLDDGWKHDLWSGAQDVILLLIVSICPNLTGLSFTSLHSELFYFFQGMPNLAVEKHSLPFSGSLRVKHLSMTYWANEGGRVIDLLEIALFLHLPNMHIIKCDGVVGEDDPTSHPCAQSHPLMSGRDSEGGDFIFLDAVFFLSRPLLHTFFIILSSLQRSSTSIPLALFLARRPLSATNIPTPCRVAFHLPIAEILHAPRSHHFPPTYPFRIPVLTAHLALSPVLKAKNRNRKARLADDISKLGGIPNPAMLRPEDIGVRTVSRCVRGVEEGLDGF